MRKSRQFYWGGFVNGKLHVDIVNDHFGGDHHIMRPALFLTRKEAREQYCDVRKVTLTHTGTQD